MKNYFLILIFALVYSSCVTDSISENTNTTSDEILPIGVVPTDLDFFTIANDVEHKTWQDLDNYYRNEILKNHYDKNYFNNLKILAFGALTMQHDLLNKADNETIYYYLQQQAEAEFLPETDTFIQYLVKLKDEKYLTGQQVADIGEKKYIKNMEYINNNFADYKKYLEGNNRGYNFMRLAKFASVAHKD